MCEVLDVSRIGCYAWLKRHQSDREKENTELTEVIKRSTRITSAVWASIGWSPNRPSWAGSTRPGVSVAPHAVGLT
jgi:hypothetical protein